MNAHIAALPYGNAHACRLDSAETHTLKLWSAADFPLRAAVKVESAATLWMGEVWACEPAQSGYNIEVELSQTLRDPRAVERMASRFRQSPAEAKEKPQQLA